MSNLSLVKVPKGGNISLDKGLTKVLIGLGWDKRTTSGEEFDLDASAFLLTGTGKVRGNQDFVFYGQMKSDNGSVQHGGDNRTGDGDGDDETINVDLSSIPAEIEKITITTTIYEAQSRNQNFGQVANAYIRLVNQETGQEVARYDLGEDYSIETAMVFGEVYRHNGEWKFRAVGQGYSGGLSAMCQQYGVAI